MPRQIPGTHFSYSVEVMGQTGRWIRYPYLHITDDIAEVEAIRIAKLMQSPTRIVMITQIFGSTANFNHLAEEVVAEYSA